MAVSDEASTANENDASLQADGDLFQPFFESLEGSFGFVLPFSWIVVAYLFAAAKKRNERCLFISGMRDESSVKIHHSQKPSQFYDCFWQLVFVDCLNSLQIWSNAQTVNVI